MAFAIPQTSAFLSSGITASKTWAIATQSEPPGISVVFWLLLFLLSCGCFHVSLKTTWRFAQLLIAKISLTQKGASSNLRQKNNQNMRGKDKNVAHKSPNFKLQLLPYPLLLLPPSAC